MLVLIWYSVTLTLLATSEAAAHPQKAAKTIAEQKLLSLHVVKTRHLLLPYKQMAPQ